MEKTDQQLIEQLIQSNEELAGLWREHLAFEEKLEDMNNRIYLAPEEQIERKSIQKMKLAGRDRIEVILSEHRVSETQG